MTRPRPTPRSGPRRVLHATLKIAVAALIVFTVPWRMAACGAGDYWDGDATATLAEGLSEKLATERVAADYETGSSLFNGEWLFGTSQMAAMAFGQLALSEEDPTVREHYIASMEAELDALLSDEVRAFDATHWESDPLADIGNPDRAHTSYLGYTNLPLSLHRMLVPDSRFAAQNDAIVAHFTNAYALSATGMLETYPDEYYPVDNAAAVASVALHAAALGNPRPEWIARWMTLLQEDYIGESGLLVQTNSEDGSPGVERGSGTALGAYFLSYADRDLAESLATAARDHLFATTLGFGALREYLPGVDLLGDIDSGPLILGNSISATGFSLSGARLIGDEAWHRRLLATTRLFGLPTWRGDDFAAGGALGNAILLAMMTVPMEAP